MRKTFKNTIQVFVILGLSLLGACGSASSFYTSLSNSNSGDANSNYETAVGGSVQELSISDGTSQITVANLEQDVVLAIHSYDNGSSQHSFQISGVGSSSSLVTEQAYLLNEAEWVDEEMAGDGDLTEEFHLMLRDIEQELDEESFVKKGTVYQFSTNDSGIGSTKQFRVLNSFSNSNSYETVTAVLKYETQDFQFYVDQRDTGAISYSNLQTLAEEFAEILPTERDIFGQESDVNGDGKFAVLFTRVVNELGATHGGIVTGYFYALDLFESSKYPVSNEMEILYTFVPDPTGEHGSSISESFAVNNIIKGVLPHEFQHMISFNQHYFVNGGSAEQGWLNESLSHLAEDFYTLTAELDITGYGLENPARVANYLADISNVCFTCGTNLSQRGGGYLFIKYLFEQAELGNLPEVESGVELLQYLLDTNLRGIGNVVNAVFGSGVSNEKFKELVALFSLAVYLSDTNMTTDDRFLIEGLDLRGLAHDNRGTYLNGPSVQSITDLPFTESLQGTSVTYIQITSDMLQEHGGKFNITSNDADHLGGYLIK